MSPPKDGANRWTVATAATVAYSGLAVILTWPLVMHLSTALLGDPTGDTGVYVWNLWIFRHELIEHGHLPLSTSHLFAYTGGTDFALHNYTPLAGVIGIPLIPWLGVVGAFNSVMLAFLTLSGLGMFLLGRQAGLRGTTAWVAGALLMASPAVTARETAHLSLITIFPLPLFLWALIRTLDHRRYRDAVLVGVLVATATYSDAYYGIYCVLMGAFLVAWRFLRIQCLGFVAFRSRAVRWLDAVWLTVAAAISWRVLSGTTVLLIGPMRIRIETLYTPMLVLVALAALRVWMTWRPTLHVNDPEGRLGGLVARAMLSVAVCLVLLSPLLVGLTLRYMQGRLPGTVTYWRSSPRGVDVLAYLVPNPNHPWFGRWSGRWLLPDAGDAFPEYVASFSLLAVIAVAVAAWKRSLPRLWVAFSALFYVLSLGPFLQLGGVNTYVIGPWALLRYLPVIGMARSPSRFAIVAALGLSLLFAFALEWWSARSGRRSRVLMVTLGIFLVLELVPAPRTLYSAEVPDVYRLIAVDQDEQGRLLELPTGIRDGTSSIGDFNASSEFFQTTHKRPLIGGYISRVSEWRKRESQRMPILQALYKLSERAGPLPIDLLERARRSREAFLARSCVRFVVVDRQRASAELRAFVVDVLGLIPVHQDDRYELLTPAAIPPCKPLGARDF